MSYKTEASLVARMVKNLSTMQETWIHPGVRKIPWRRTVFALYRRICLCKLCTNSFKLHVTQLASFETVFDGSSPLILLWVPLWMAGVAYPLVGVSSLCWTVQPEPPLSTCQVSPGQGKCVCRYWSCRWLQFVRICMYCFSKYLHHCRQLHSQWVRSPTDLHSLQHLVFSDFVNYCHPNGWKIVSQRGLELRLPVPVMFSISLFLPISCSLSVFLSALYIFGMCFVSCNCTFSLPVCNLYFPFL